MSWRSHKPESHQEWRKQQANGPEESRIEPTPPWVIGRTLECKRRRNNWGLDLEWCELKSLPMELILLVPTLTTISLRCNYLMFLAPSVLSALVGLQHLNLRYMPSWRSRK